MIIIFIKEHVVGFQIGDVKDVDNEFAERMIETGYAEESTEEDLKHYTKNIVPVDTAKALEEAKKAANEESDCEGCQGSDEPCVDCQESGVEDNPDELGNE